MKLKSVITLSLLTILISGCANRVDIHSVASITESPSGFWFGLWNGFTVFFSFIGSIFFNDIAIYDVNNNGFMYDLGFMFGIGGFGSTATNVSSN